MPGAVPALGRAVAQEVDATRDEDAARSIVGPEYGGGAKCSERRLEAAGAVGFAADPPLGKELGMLASGIDLAHRLVDVVLLRRAGGHDAIDLAPYEVVGRSARDLASGQDLRVIHLVQAFHPRRLVRHRTDQRVVDVLARADIADHRRAGMQAKACAKARPAELAPFLGKLATGGRGLQGRAAGVDDVVGIGLRRVPERHYAVADVL